MRINRFKGRILNVARPPLALLEFNKPIDDVFVFSRSRIFFNDQQMQQHLILEPPSPIHSTTSFRNGIKYSFDKIYNDYDKKVFQITVGTHSYSSPIKLNWINKIKCNILHNRYFIQRNKDELYKIIFAAVVGGFISFFVATYSYEKGYKKGFSNGLKTQQKKNHFRP
jgi:hypothetical protein